MSGSSAPIGERREASGAEALPGAKPVRIRDHPSDGELVSAARAGDLQAFEALYRRHVGRTHALALRMTADPREAEEATQDVWVRAWERLGTFRDQSAFTTWIHRIAVNLILDRERRRSTWTRRTRPLDHPGMVRRARTPERTEDRLALEAALAALPEGARHMFVLHEIEGLKCREVAEVTGTAVGTVKAQLHRARRLLKEALS